MGPFKKWLDKRRVEGNKLPVTDDNVRLAKEFLFVKWKQRAVEMMRDEPVNLNNSCKFATLFAQSIFGGEIVGNWHHQVLKVDNRIIDLTDSDLLAHHDKEFFGNKDHQDSMRSCEIRVRKWVDEFWKWYEHE